MNFEFVAAQQGDEASTQALLSMGAQVNAAPSKDGLTPLVVSAALGHGPVARLLLEQGADPNVADNRGYTALHFAAANRGLIELLKLLLAKGANPNAQVTKETGKVYWFTKNYNELIDERDDPLELEGFFPCSKPLYSTTTSDTLIPVPDFVLYQDQANELDILSDRIDGLVKALRIRGVYDASQPALQRLLTEGDNNTLVPVDKWLAFSEKGGLKGSIDILPIEELANALLQCYRARQEIKAQIYEITGISDIIRGASQASETATAQQIKGQYAGLRLRSMQEEVALFASELIRLKAQVICGKFQPQTILSYAAANQMTPQDQQMIPQAMQLMQSNPLRNFQIGRAHV